MTASAWVRQAHNVAGGLCDPILGGGIQSILALCAGNLVVRRRGSDRMDSRLRGNDVGGSRNDVDRHGNDVGRSRIDSRLRRPLNN